MKQSSCKEVAVSGLVSLVSRPDHLHCLRPHPLVLVVIVQPPEEQTVKPHVSEYVCLFPAVSERINLPGNPGSAGGPEVVS